MVIFKSSVFIPLMALVIVATGLFGVIGAISANAFPVFRQFHRKSEFIPRMPLPSLCELHTDQASPEAAELARHLNLTSLFSELETLRKQASAGDREKLLLERKEKIRDIKQDLVEAIEQARLEVDYVQAELSIEIAGHSELVQKFSEDRDEFVNKTNLWSFRTNGALWAIAEAMAIPTYRQPRFAIPSGAVGIVAGIVPSAFSIFATRSLKGGRYEREARPNMLAKIFDYPVVARTEYPDSVLAYLHTVPSNSKDNLSRLDQLIGRWAEDKNIHSFSDRNSRKQLDAITGSVQIQLTIELVADRLTMLQQLSAVINQINRPLLELMMVVRGLKHFSTNLNEIPKS